MKRAILCIALAPFGCATPEDKAKTALPPPPDERALSADQRAAYEQCLKESQAVAMAWEAIEDECLKRALAVRP